MKILDRLLSTDADSFRGKLYLLLLDKLVIGAVLAIAFLVYDRYRVADTQRLETARSAESQRFQKEMATLADSLERERGRESQRRAEQAAKIQREFEKAKLLAEALPKITSQELDVVTRAYMLRAAVSAESLDHDTAIDIAPTFLRHGLSDDDFRRIVGQSVPNALRRVAARGNQLLSEWTKLGLRPDVVPWLPGSNNVPDNQVAIAKEVPLWRVLILEHVQEFDGGIGSHQRSRNMFIETASGLCFLLHTEDKHEIELRSRATEPSLRLAHELLITCDLNSSTATKNAASDYVGQSLALAFENLNDIEYARAVVRAFRTFGTHEDNVPSTFSSDIHDQVSKHLARILVTDFQGPHKAELFFLRGDAGELLARMGADAQPADSLLIGFLTRFRRDVEGAPDKAAKENLSSKWESGKLLRHAVETLGAINSDAARAELTALVKINPDVWPAFPFLKDAAERALEPEKQRKGT